MQERTIQLGGELNIDSRKGGGTHLLAEIPLWLKRVMNKAMILIVDDRQRIRR